jgi:hypothetical protein
MPVHDFIPGPNQGFSSLGGLPDFRTDAEKLNSPLSIYNHNSPDIAWAERAAEEMINISGAWVTIFPRTANAEADDLWEEDADPTYKSGVKLKGYFVPQPVSITLTKWGIDAPNGTTVIFSRAIIFQTFNDRMLRPGDVLEVPHNTLSPVQAPQELGSLGNRMDKFRILNAQDTGNFKYRWLYFSCRVENLTGDETIQVMHR